CAAFLGLPWSMLHARGAARVHPSSEVFTERNIVNCAFQNVDFFPKVMHDNTVCRCIRARIESQHPGCSTDPGTLGENTLIQTRNIAGYRSPADVARREEFKFRLAHEAISSFRLVWSQPARFFANFLSGSADFFAFLDIKPQDDR